MSSPEQIAEQSAVEYANLAAKDLAHFFVGDPGFFRVAYQSGDELQKKEEPNAATSMIALVYEHLKPYRTPDFHIEPWKRLDDLIKKTREAIGASNLCELLPLRSFGPLPLFSTSYLAEVLPGCSGAVVPPAYGITLRRILLTLCREKRGTEEASPGEVLHPFLVYRCLKVLRQLKDTIDRDSAFMKTVSTAAFDSAAIERELGSACGASAGEALEKLGVTDTKFNADLRKILKSSHHDGYALELMHYLESLALNDALAQIARHTDASSQRADPSALAYSLRCLAIIDDSKHYALLKQGLSIAGEYCQGGVFLSTMPFYLDARGRTLLVPSVEIANAILFVTLEVLNRLPADSLAHVLDTTNSIHDRLVEERHIIRLATAENLGGWCSDRAPSSQRIDSWVTAQVFAFFVLRLRLLEHVRRAQALGSYSWTRHNDIRTTWGELVDPDEGVVSPGVKHAIAAAIEGDPANRDSSPTFLLYGPPGTSKTTFAQAIAKHKQWDLVSLSPSDFVADSLDKIEYRSRQIFADLLSLDRCVVLLDEMDSLLRNRDLLEKGTILEFVIPALLPKLQDLHDYAKKREMAVFFATNYYDTIDPAISRAGRIDHHIAIMPFTRQARNIQVRKMVSKLQLEAGKERSLIVDLETALSSAENNLVYRDLEALVTQGNRLPELGRTVALEERAAKLGIQPEVYQATRRPAALAEFVLFAHRLLNLAPPASLTTDSKDSLRTHLKTIKDNLDRRWDACVKQWFVDPPDA